VASIEPERILQLIEPLARRFVATIGKPAGCLEQNRGTEEAVAVPPVTWATGGAAKA